MFVGVHACLQTNLLCRGGTAWCGLCHQHVVSLLTAESAGPGNILFLICFIFFFCIASLQVPKD